jgi:hypothetical protein
MGWTSTYRAPGQSHKDFFTQEGHRQDNERIHAEIVTAAAVGSTVYMAYRITEKATNESKVIGLVFLTENLRGGYNNFSYKDMDEEMGPTESRCPQAILKLLTPLPPAPAEGRDPHEYARAWRARCEANLTVKKSITAGSHFKLDAPLVFGSQYKIEFFEVVSASPWVIRGHYEGRNGLSASIQVKFPKPRLQALIVSGRAVPCTLSELDAHFAAQAAA